jgi:hypothetical protein
MVHVSTMLAALGCLLPYSSFLFVSGSPVNTLAVPSEQIKGSGLPDGYKLTPINWRGTLEEGKPLVYLSGDSFEVCFHPVISLCNGEHALTHYLHVRTSRSKPRLSTRLTPSSVNLPSLSLVHT